MERVKPTARFDRTRKDKSYIINFSNPGLVISEGAQATDDILEKIDKRIAISKQLREVQQLQNQWDQAIGNTTQQDTLLRSNYNPVLARWNFERQQTPQQKEQFREEELKNIQTASRERNQTAESRFVLRFDEERKIRHEMFPDEPYEQMLERGVAYRDQHGSQELDRERAEIVGFQRRQEILANPKTPIGTKLVTFSPPGIVEGSCYTLNFVDIEELAEDEITKERIIKYTRFASSLDYEQYMAIAKQFDPTYFTKKEEVEKALEKEIPRDAWYLANSFQIQPSEDATDADAIFSQYFEKDSKAMEEQEWQRRWQQLYVPFALHLIDILTQEKFDPVAIAEAYNTLLHSGENKKMQQQVKEKTIFVAPKTGSLTDDMRRQITGFVRLYGRAEVEERPVGCGSSGGVSIKDKGTASILSNSVAQFGVSSSGGTREHFNCPECHYKASGPIGNTCPGCGLTKEAYAEKTGVSCD